jgi:putative ABC transport system ATP-binding protein
LFRELVEAGKTVIVVTHEEVSAAGYERIVTLSDGKLVGDERRAA